MALALSQTPTATLLDWALGVLSHLAPLLGPSQGSSAYDLLWGYVCEVSSEADRIVQP